MVDADLVEVMIALPGQLFFNTQIPACLWYLAKDKRTRRGEVLFVDGDVIVIIAAHMPRRNVDPGDLVAWDLRRARREQDALDLVGHLQILIEPLFLRGFGENAGGGERESRLLRDRFENLKFALEERLAVFGPGHQEHPQILPAVDERSEQRAGGAARSVPGRLEAGVVWVNSWFLRDLRTAFGGMKQSGIGREGGVHSLEFYTETKNVCVKL